LFRITPTLRNGAKATSIVAPTVNFSSAEPFKLQRREIAGKAGIEAIVIAEKIETDSDSIETKRDPIRDPLDNVPHAAAVVVLTTHPVRGPTVVSSGVQSKSKHRERLGAF
jgi:hypothetical protein